MLFSTHLFILVFLPLTLAVYYLAARSTRLRQWALIAASLVFYGWWDPRLLPLLAGSVLANWLCVRLFARRHRRRILSIGIVLNLLVLSIFKYADFFTEPIFALLGQEPHSFGIVLPLGISFFTFQQVSYLADLGRHETTRIYPFREYALFVTFFPQLIAGPIVRHDEIIEQFPLSPLRPGLAERFGRGMAFFVVGLAKKVALADTLAPMYDQFFQWALAGKTLGVVEAWQASAGFTLQVYFDFSGYSDMALGMALMCGLRIPFNFDAPYRSTSLAEFWRRWHITLSRFFRDYVYFPLGGARCSPLRRTWNLVVTMTLAGLWHGASWNCTLWGGMHGVGLAAHAWWRRDLDRRMHRLAGWALTLLFFMVTIVVFRAYDLPSSFRVIASMFGAGGIGSTQVDAVHVWLIAWAVALIGPSSQVFLLERLRPRVAYAVVGAALFVYLLFLIGGRTAHEFVYFQF